LAPEYLLPELLLQSPLKRAGGLNSDEREREREGGRERGREESPLAPHLFQVLDLPRSSCCCCGY
jgi:hypothetical protein